MKDNIMKKTEFPLSQTVMRLAELGLDENEISYSLGITKRKFDGLKKQKNISFALASGAGFHARKVEHALYRRAVGFEYEEVVNASTSPVSKVNSGIGKSARKNNRNTSAGTAEKSSAKSTIKTVIPDVTACIFWLKNRHPEKWLDPKDALNGKKPLTDALEDFDEKSENI